MSNLVIKEKFTVLDRRKLFWWPVANGMLIGIFWHSSQQKFHPAALFLIVLFALMDADNENTLARYFSVLD
jgi:hypothetical protein